MKILHVNPNGQELESWIALLDNEVVGHVYMKVEPNNKVKFLDAWVHENHRRKNIYRQLYDARWEHVKEFYKGYTIYAWCKNSSLPVALEKGFVMGEFCTYVETKI